MRRRLFSFMVLIILLVACAPERSPATSQSELAQPTTAASTSLSKMPVVAAASTPEETGLKTQCLDVATKPVNEVETSGIVILDRVNSGGHDKGGTLSLDMATGATTQINLEREGQLYHIVSPNKDLLAYKSVMFNAEGDLIRNELIIADTAGRRLKAISWEKEWLTTVAWLDNERLIINLLLTSEESFGKEPLTLIALNPFTDERQILKPDFPKFLDRYSILFPAWQGWYGVVYDPTLNFAVYPYLFGNDNEMYTYALWDLSKQELVTSLEDTFAAFSALSDRYPMPHWSPEGSQFVFEGMLETSNPMKSELYRVTVDGQVEQITHLAPIANVQDSNFSWSPDGKHIAMFLNTWGTQDEEKARVAVLNMETLDVIDYCISLTYGGEGFGGRDPSSPVWSPDSKQFLVVDWYKRDYQRLILIDIEKNTAVEIPENMEPVGWMVTP